MGKKAMTNAIDVLVWNPVPNSMMISGAIACNGNDCEMAMIGANRISIILNRSARTDMTKLAQIAKSDAVIETENVAHQFAKKWPG
jgi:hypothetical protein